MTSFWKTVADVTGEKLHELGAIGTILGLVWVVGVWVLYDWMMGAFNEGVASAGTMMRWMLLGWLLIGLAVYLWRDPHSVRETLATR